MKIEKVLCSLVAGAALLALTKLLALAEDQNQDLLVEILVKQESTWWAFPESLLKRKAEDGVGTYKINYYSFYEKASQIST